MKNIAVILSGGSGSRLKSDENIPKQYLKLADKMVIEHCIDTFEKNNYIDEIAIVAHINYHDMLRNMVEKSTFKKVKQILHSGETRGFSSLSAITTYSVLHEECNLIFHDAVRPLVSHDLIDNCIEALNTYNAVSVGFNAVDTILSVNEDKTIKDIPSRDNLMHAQTPQGLKLSLIKKAYAEALQDKNFQTTDDCGVIKKYLPQEKIFVINGSASNIKITYIEDLHQADRLLQLKYYTQASKYSSIKKY